MRHRPDVGFVVAVYVQDEIIARREERNGFFDRAGRGDCHSLDGNASFEGSAVREVDFAVGGLLFFKEPHCYEQRKKEE